MKRTIVVGLLVSMLGVAGCGGESAPEASSGPTATSAPELGDEQQIRALIDEQEAAMVGFDFERMAELTCTQYRETVRAQPDTMFPPLSAAGTAEELAAKPVDMLTEALTQQYPTASEPNIARLVDALVRYDEPAYKAANLDILRETTTVTIDKVENVTVSGDTATADVTTTWKSGSAEPATSTDANTYRKEEGQWKDCQDPGSK